MTQEGEGEGEGEGEREQEGNGVEEARAFLVQYAEQNATSVAAQVRAGALGHGLMTGHVCFL